MEQEVERLRARNVKLMTGLAFAACTIKSGEAWSPNCDRMIGSVLET